MNLNFINEVIKLSLILAFISLIIVSFFLDLSYGAGVLIGAIWGVFNLLCIKQVIVNTMTPGEKDVAKIFIGLGIKFPILYLTGFGLLKISYLPSISLLIGFSLIFFIILIKGLDKILRNQLS